MYVLVCETTGCDRACARATSLHKRTRARLFAAAEAGLFAVEQRRPRWCEERERDVFYVFR